jgi:phosphatidylglycerol:prolipoprotein diacylglycerol transferase
MIRELFHIGPISISPFGVMLVAAFACAFFQLRWGLRRLGVGDDEAANSMLFAGGLGGIVGGKVYYALLYGDWRLLYNRSGLVWYGSLIAGALAVLWVIRRRRLPLLKTADAAAPALALGYGVGRIGCFLVGDDYGVPTDLPWGMAFPEGPIPTTAGWLRSEFGISLPPEITPETLIKVHPTQLYETVIALLIWWLGVALLRRLTVPTGTVTWIVLLLLGAERFGIELLRAKDDRFFGDFTLAQILSVALMAIAAAFWLGTRRRRAAARAAA